MSEEQQQYPPLSPEEEDRLFCFKLRGRLSAISFKLVYKNMQKISAWKYTSTTGHYHYKELNFGSAKDAMEKLDECALQDLTFCKSLSRKVQDERYKAIREELLTAIFYGCECGREPEKKPLPCFYFDAEDAHDLDEMEEEAKEQNETSTTSYKKHLEGAQNQYATSNEPGAEMVLDRSRTSSKKSAKENQKLQFPSAVDCVQRMRKMSLQTDAHLDIEDCVKAHGEEWEFLLETGHSLLFHGLGSKKQLLEKFGKTYLRARGGVLEVEFLPSESREPYVHTRDQILTLVQLLHNQAISNPSAALNIETRASALHMRRDLSVSRNTNRIATNNLQAANVAAEQVRLGLRHAALQPNGNRPDPAQRDAILNRGPIPTQPALSFRAEARAEGRARGDPVITPNRNPTVTTPNRNPTTANPITVEHTPTGNRRVERNGDAILRIDQGRGLEPRSGVKPCPFT